MNLKNVLQKSALVFAFTTILFSCKKDQIEPKSLSSLDKDFNLKTVSVSNKFEEPSLRFSTEEEARKFLNALKELKTKFERGELKPVLKEKTSEESLINAAIALKAKKKNFDLRNMSSSTFKVTLVTEYGTHEIEVPDDQSVSIQEAALDQGIFLPGFNSFGTNGSTGAKLVSGSVDNSSQSYLDDCDVDNGYILLDTSYPLSDCRIETGKEEQLGLCVPPIIKTYIIQENLPGVPFNFQVTITALCNAKAFKVPQTPSISSQLVGITILTNWQQNTPVYSFSGNISPNIKNVLNWSLSGTFSVSFWFEGEIKLYSETWIGTGAAHVAEFS